MTSARLATTAAHDARYSRLLSNGYVVVESRGQMVSLRDRAKKQGRRITCTKVEGGLRVHLLPVEN